jgi:hypothetical protein
VGWVRNVVLINVYLDLENPRGSGFWVEGYMSQMRKWGVSLQATWERGGRILSQQGGFQGSRERGAKGSKGEQRGTKGSKGKYAVYIIHVLFVYIME